MRQTFDCPSMAKLKMEHGERWLLKMLVVIVTRGLDQFKVKYKMEGDEIALFCDDLMHDYKHDTPEDIMMVMKQAKDYEFEENHHCVDGPTVRGWITAYMEKKADMRVNINQRYVEEVEGEMPVHIITDEEMADLHQAIQNPNKPKPERSTYEGQTQYILENISTTYIDSGQTKYRYSDDVLCTSLTELHMQEIKKVKKIKPTDPDCLITIYENEITRRGKGYKPDPKLVDELKRIHPQGATIIKLQQRPITEVNAPEGYKKGDGRKLRINYSENDNKNKAS